jgi:hypothetical protein
VPDLIRQMSMAKRLWGAPRIHGELLKLGIEIAESTVAKYMVKRPTTWSELDGLPTQPCGRDRRRGPFCRANDRLD